MGLFDEIVLREPLDAGGVKLYVLQTKWTLYFVEGKVAAECYEHIERGDMLYEFVAYVELHPACGMFSRLPSRDDCRVERIEQGGMIGCVRLGDIRRPGVRTAIYRREFIGPPPGHLAFHFNGEVSPDGWVTLDLIAREAVVRLLWDREEKVYALLEVVFRHPIRSLGEAENEVASITQLLGLSLVEKNGAGAGIRTRAGHRQRSLSPPPLVGAARMPLT